MTRYGEHMDQLRDPWKECADGEWDRPWWWFQEHADRVIGAGKHKNFRDTPAAKKLPQVLKDVLFPARDPVRNFEFSRDVCRNGHFHAEEYNEVGGQWGEKDWRAARKALRGWALERPAKKGQMGKRWTPEQVDAIEPRDLMCYLIFKTWPGLYEDVLRVEMLWDRLSVHLMGQHRDSKLQRAVRGGKVDKVRTILRGWGADVGVLLAYRNANKKTALELAAGLPMEVREEVEAAIRDAEKLVGLVSRAQNPQQCDFGADGSESLRQCHGGWRVANDIGDGVGDHIETASTVSGSLGSLVRRMGQCHVANGEKNSHSAGGASAKRRKLVAGVVASSSASGARRGASSSRLESLAADEHDPLRFAHRVQAEERWKDKQWLRLRDAEWITDGDQVMVAVDTCPAVVQYLTSTLLDCTPLPFTIYPLISSVSDFGNCVYARASRRAVEKDPSMLRFVDSVLQKECPEIVRIAVSGDGIALRFASEPMKDRRANVMVAVENNGLALQFASDGMKNDRAIVMAAVKNNGLALHYASIALRDDRGIVMVAVANESEALKFASDGMANDRAIVMAAVANDGDALEYASDALADDRGVVMAAVDNNGEALGFASYAMKDDREIVKTAVRTDGLALEYASKALRDDRGIVMAAVGANAFALEFASKALRADRVVVMAAVEFEGWALQFASDAMKDDRAIVMAAVANDGDALEYASDALADDRGVIMAAVDNNGWALGFASDAMKDDRAIVMAAVKDNGGAFEFASDGLQNNRAIVMAAVQNRGVALQFASDGLKNNRAIVMAAVEQFGFALEFASEALRNDREIVRLAIVESNCRRADLPSNCRGGQPLRFASKALQRDPELQNLARAGEDVV